MEDFFFRIKPLPSMRGPSSVAIASTSRSPGHRPHIISCRQDLLDVDLPSTSLPNHHSLYHLVLFPSYSSHLYLSRLLEAVIYCVTIRIFCLYFISKNHINVFVAFFLHENPFKNLNCRYLDAKVSFHLPSSRFRIANLSLQM